MVLPLLLLAWQLGAARLNQPWILPTALEVAGQLAHPLREHYASGSLAVNTAVSMIRVGLGFILAAVVGVALGLVMGSVRAVRGLLEPVIELLRPLCPIAWIPFAIAVFKLKTVPQLFKQGPHVPALVYVVLDTGTHQKVGPASRVQPVPEECVDHDIRSPHIP